MIGKDYQLIADILNKHIVYWEESASTEELDSSASVNALRDVALSLAGEFGASNLFFDRKRFLEDSGYYVK